MPESPSQESSVFKRRLWPIPLLLLIPFVVPIPEFLDKIYFLRIFGSFCHFALPGLLAAFFYWVFGGRGRIVPAILLAFALSAGSEIAQSLVGRHPRFTDAGIDLSGILFTTGILMRREGRSLAIQLPLLMFLAVVPWMLWEIPGNIIARREAMRRFPVIADFDTHTDEVLWGQSKKGVGRIWLPKDQDEPGRILCFSAGAQDEWPGIAMRGLPRDWSGWRKLVFEARVIEGDPLVLAVRLDDFHGEKDRTWCYTYVDLDRTWQKYEIDLQELAASLESRIFRLDDLSQIVLYLVGVKTQTVVGIDNLVLEQAIKRDGGG